MLSRYYLAEFSQQPSELQTVTILWLRKLRDTEVRKLAQSHQVDTKEQRSKHRKSESRAGHLNSRVHPPSLPLCVGAGKRVSG